MFLVGPRAPTLSEAAQDLSFFQHYWLVIVTIIVTTIAMVTIIVMTINVIVILTIIITSEHLTVRLRRSARK